jgi:hypothetical protein
MFSGFISQNSSWTIQYWYNVPLQALVLLTCFLFLHETGFTRDQQAFHPTPPTSFFPNRLATFIKTEQVVPKSSWAEVVSVFHRNTIQCANSDSTDELRWHSIPHRGLSGNDYWWDGLAREFRLVCWRQHRSWSCTSNTSKIWGVRFHTRPECFL